MTTPITATENTTTQVVNPEVIVLTTSQAPALTTEQAPALSGTIVTQHDHTMQIQKEVISDVASENEGHISLLQSLEEFGAHIAVEAHNDFIATIEKLKALF